VCNKKVKGKQSKGVDEEIIEVHDFEHGASISNGSDVDEPKGKKQST